MILLLLLSTIIATIFGIYGQSLAYFLNGAIGIFPTHVYLTILTIASVVLYILAAFGAYSLYRKHALNKGLFGLYFFGNLGIGSITSMWSLFVLAMW